MNVIYSHPKSAFKRVVGVSYMEIGLWSAIAALLGWSVYDSIRRIAHIKAGGSASQSGNPADYLFIALTVAVLYVIGLAVTRPLIRRHNAEMNEQIDAATAAVRERTGIEMEHINMAHYIEVAVKVEPISKTETVGSMEHTLDFSAEGDKLSISHSVVVQHKYAPAPLRTALGGIG